MSIITIASPFLLRQGFVYSLNLFFNLRLGIGKGNR